MKHLFSTKDLFCGQFIHVLLVRLLIAVLIWFFHPRGKIFSLSFCSSQLEVSESDFTPGWTSLSISLEIWTEKSRVFRRKQLHIFSKIFFEFLRHSRSNSKGIKNRSKADSKRHFFVSAISINFVVTIRRRSTKPDRISDCVRLMIQKRVVNSKFEFRVKWKFCHRNLSNLHGS